MIELEVPRSREALNWSGLGRALAKLGLVGAVIGWSATLGSSVTPSLLQQNTQTPQDRSRVLLGAAIGVAGVLLVALVALIARRWAAVRFLDRLGSAVAPFGVLALLPTLLMPDVWFGNPLPFLVMLGLLVLLMERLLRSWLEAMSPVLSTLRGLGRAGFGARLRRYAPIAIVLLGSSAFAAFVFYYSRQQHQRLGTAAYDLGIYDNLMYTAISGQPFKSTVLVGPDGPSYLVGHAEFALLLFAPFYWLAPRPESLLALQAIALGFAAVPLYAFARTQLTRGTALALALAYLLYAPMHGSCFYDFHWLPISIIFNFTMLFAIARRRHWLFTICFVILILIREDVSIGLTMLGAFLLLSGIRPKLGLMMAIVSAVSFVFIRFGVMVWAGTWVFPNMLYGQLVAPGESGFGSVIRTLASNPAYALGTVLDAKKLSYFLHLMAPLVFLPLRRLVLGLLFCAGTLLTLLTTAYDPTISIAFQYPSHWIPYLFAAVVMILGLMSRQADGGIRRRAAVGALLFGVTVHSYVFGAVLQHDTFVGGFLRLPYQITQSERSTYAALRRVVAKIPPTASVAATDMEVPHVSNRLAVYTLRAFHGDADYLLINRGGLASDSRNTLKDGLSRNDYGLIVNDGPFYLFKRDADTPGTEEALRALGLRARDRKRSQGSGGGK